MEQVSGAPVDPESTYPLPGREPELTELTSLLDRAIHGRGGVALISGEAGIGKSTLCERLVLRAGKSGARAITGHCYNLTIGQPYAPWIELGQSPGWGSSGKLLPALSLASADASGPGSKLELFAQISIALRNAAACTPLVLIVEDVHWADHASIELLRYIGRQADSLPLLLIATYRENDPDAEGALLRTLPDLVRESRARRFVLRPLSAEDIEEFVAAECDLNDAVRSSIVAYLYERSEGNPFFMTELLRDVMREGVAGSATSDINMAELREMPVPVLIRQVIQNRVQDLSSSTRELLDIAAVIGHDVPVDVWQAVSRVAERELADAIEEASASHLLVESRGGTSVRFAHALVQETLYRGQVALRQRSRHREIARYLADHPASSPDVVAHHLERANDEAAIDWLVRAARRASEVYAAPDAIRHVTRAADLAEQFGVSLPADAYRTRALAHEMLGEIELAKADAMSLLQAAREEGDRSTECRALIDLGLLWAGQDYQRSGDYLDQALTISRQLDDYRVHAQCLNRVANWQANAGQLETAIGMNLEALRIFEATGDRDGIADTLDLLGSANYLAGNYSASVAYYDRAIRYSREFNDRVRLTSSLANLAIIGGDCDVSFDASVAATRSPEKWVSYGEEAVQIAREIGWKSGESFSLAMLGTAVGVRGNLGRALRLLEEGHEIARQYDHQQWQTATSVILGSLWSELLDTSRAEFHLGRARGSAEGLGSRFWPALIDAALAILRAENGDVRAGQSRLAPWLKTDDMPRSHEQRAVQFAAGRVWLAADEPATALEIAEGLLSLEEEPSEAGGIPQVLKLKADALARLNQVEAADAAYARASHSAELLGYRAIHWQVLRDWSAIAIRRRQQRQANELRSNAETMVSDIARTITDPETRNRFHQRALERIRSAGQPPSPDHKATAGLSRRELEVLSLVAEGLTDAQVAERLFISPRTVARHLQSIYTKLGVNSRAGATSFAYKHELIS